MLDTLQHAWALIALIMLFLANPGIKGKYQGPVLVSLLVVLGVLGITIVSLKVGYAASKSASEYFDCNFWNHSDCQRKDGLIVIKEANFAIGSVCSDDYGREEYANEAKNEAERMVRVFQPEELGALAAHGNRRAQSILGGAFAYGVAPFPKEEVIAVKYLRLAAKGEDTLAEVNLGRMYLLGLGGLAKNDGEAIKLFKLAADQRSAVGQVALGIAYACGKYGVKKSAVEAVKLFKLATDQGYPPGQALLGMMYNNGWGGLPRDDIEAARLFKLAADHGNRLAEDQLAKMPTHEQ